MMQEARHFEARFRQTSVIVFAMLAGVFIYFLVAYLLSQAGEVTIGSMARYEQIRRILYGGAAMLSLGAIVFRRSRLSQAQLNRVYAAKGTDGVVERLMMTTMGVAAMSEAVALVGLVLSILGHRLEDMLRLGGIGAILLLYHSPRRSAWQRVIERARYVT
jgi:hypothetical protein